MDENMRRLPPWMLAGGSSGVTASSDRTDNKNVGDKRKHEPEAPKIKGEKRPRRSAKPKDRDDSEEPKKVEVRRRRGERVRSRIGAEEAKTSIGDGKNPETFQSAIGPEDEHLTVDDLLSFAQEYVKGEEDLTRSESMVVVDESNMRSSQRETDGTRDSTAEDMLGLLLGPYFKKPN